MAGFFIYSLDWKKFQKFTKKPTKKQLKKFAESLDDRYERVMDELEETDVAHSWSADAKDHEAAIQERLASEDWYGDLSDEACGIWEWSMFDLANDAANFDFRCESDGVYWYVIQYCEEHASKTSKSSAIARFGHWPYGLQKAPKQPKDFLEPHWMPYHSMRPPEEVEQMLAEAKAADKYVKSKKDRETYDELIDTLIPTLEKIAADERMLFVQVDT